MSDKVLVDRDLIKEAMAAAQERDVEMAKVASLEAEKSVLYGVLDLVQEGLLDPLSVLEKAAEYLEHPEELSFFKRAARMSNHSFSIGTVASVDNDLDSADESPETQFISRLNTFVN